MAEMDGTEAGSSARMACTFCRKRKLRCDRVVPTCESCKRYGYDCAYGRSRGVPRKETGANSKSSPSHVKRLKDRLAEIERLLVEATSTQKRSGDERPGVNIVQEPPVILASQHFLSTFDESTIQELEQRFFVFIQPSVRIVHQSRYLRSAHFHCVQPPPAFLRHALCALAATTSESHSGLQDQLYQSARRLLQEAEIKDQNFDKVTLAHAQTWILIAVYELKQAFMHRSLMSTSRAVRLVQLMRLHRVDGPAPRIDSSLNLLAPPGDWTEAEERRRLFWFTFLMDRYAGISMGWPTLIDLKDIRTYLPASDDAIENSREESSVFMPEAASFSNNRWRLPTFASQIVGVSICFSRVQELQRLELKESMDTPNGTTKPTSVKIGKILGDIFGSPPHPDTLPEPLDPSNVFLRMGHGAIMIILHRVAKAQASNVDFPSEVVNRSQVHCDEAAAAILRTMKLTSHWNVHIFHPCTAFSLYVGVLAFADAWLSNQTQTNEEPLRFMLDSLRSFQKTTKLASYLLGDIETEFPGLIAKMNGEPTTDDSVYLDFLAFDPESPLPNNGPQGPLRQSSPEYETIQQTQPERTAQMWDVTHDQFRTWTVEDPDIAKVSTYWNCAS